MIEAAAEIALNEGLDKVTAKRVAAELGVFPGLVDHYFSADQLVACAFAYVATDERDQMFAALESEPDPLTKIRRLVADLLQADRDPISLLWLDAWQASRHRPSLRGEVASQMNEDIRGLAELIQRGVDGGQIRVDEPASAAVQIFALADGLSVQAAIRGLVDYADMQVLIGGFVEQILGLNDRPANEPAPELPA